MITDVGLLWQDIQKLEGDVDRDFIFAKIVSHYADFRRAFHVLHHAQHVRNTTVELASQYAPNEPIMEGIFAAWFHDLIYEPGAPDNETKSGELAAQALEGVTNIDIPKVVGMIESTQDHTSTPNTLESCLIDADMRILSTKTATYHGFYVPAIRHEFSFLNTPTWNAKRAEFLSRTLEAPVYLNIKSKDKVARNNMENELTSLLK